MAKDRGTQWLSVREYFSLARFSKSAKFIPQQLLASAKTLVERRKNVT